MLSHLRFLVLLAIVFLASTNAANACSCGRTPTVLNSYDGSDVVVIVRAVAVDKAEPAKTAPEGQMSNGENYVDGVKSTTMSVEQVFKGTSKVGDKMIFAQGGGADCIWTFNEKDIGKKYLFYLKRLENFTVWIAGTCGRSSIADYAGDDLLYLNNLDKTRGRTRISGTLSFANETGESVAGRKIRLVGAGHTYEVKTDKNGVYEIYDVPAERYSVEPETPRGWKIANFWLHYSPSFAGSDETKSARKIPIVVADKQHAGLDIRFEIDNAVRGHIYDSAGRPMTGVCLDLVPADGTKGAYLADCTEKDGAFDIDEIPPGGYVLVVNDDGKVTSSEPFGTFYYPNVKKREDATVFHIGIGEFVENLQIYPPVTAETITVEGVFLYSDGKPVASEWVSFKSATAGQTRENDDDDDEKDAGAETDSKGRFSIKILKDSKGSLFGWMYTYLGEYENCPQLDRLIKQFDKDIPEIKTPPVEIFAQNNLYGVALKFPFPSCKKAK
jgi:hypothetical protein